jgi:hypothetical protein
MITLNIDLTELTISQLEALVEIAEKVDSEIASKIAEYLDSLYE